MKTCVAWYRINPKKNSSHQLSQIKRTASHYLLTEPHNINNYMQVIVTFETFALPTLPLPPLTTVQVAETGSVMTVTV